MGTEFSALLASHAPFRLMRIAMLGCCCAILLSVSLNANAVPKNHGKMALPGGDNVGVLVNEQGRSVAVGAYGGYGIVESTGPVAGVHHGIYGSFSGSLYLAPQFAMALGLGGMIQFHPKDQFHNLPKDRSFLGEPYLLLRSGFPINSHLLLGGELRVWIPGAKAPSLVWSATTVDFVSLVTVLPAPNQTLSIKAGFRLDNSENAAPDPAHVRYGDRVSFPMSSYHAVLAGILWMYHLDAVSIWTELSADMLMASKVSPASSPIRVSAGVSYHVRKNFELNMLTTASLSKRPGILADDPLIPIEPRILLFAGAILKFGGEIQDTLDGAKEVENADDTDTPGPPHAAQATGGTIASSVMDRDGLPIAGARVTLTTDTLVKTVVTDRDGKFEFSEIPEGEATLRIEMPFFNPRIETVEIVDGKVWTAQLPPLMESEVGSQIRGLVRNLKGAAISATIHVKPGNTRIATNPEGEFQLDVEPGKYRVIIKSKGFKSQRRMVTVGTNSVEILNVELRAK